MGNLSYSSKAGEYILNCIAAILHAQCIIYILL